MATASPAQTRDNHVRTDPSFHYFLVPFMVIVLVCAVIALVHRPHLVTGVLLGISIALLLLIFKARLYALRVQDRLIRLEERLRLAALAPASLQSRIEELTIAQLVALRFASDAELPPLAQRALDEQLTSGQIKAAIITWRPDTFRV